MNKLKYVNVEDHTKKGYFNLVLAGKRLHDTCNNNNKNKNRKI